MPAVEPSPATAASGADAVCLVRPRVDCALNFGTSLVLANGVDVGPENFCPKYCIHSGSASLPAFRATGDDSASPGRCGTACAGWKGFASGFKLGSCRSARQ